MKELDEFKKFFNKAIEWCKNNEEEIFRISKKSILIPLNSMIIICLFFPALIIMPMLFITSNSFSEFKEQLIDFFNILLIR